MCKVRSFLANSIRCVACMLWASSVANADVDFNREVRPILAKHCFTCHGPDENAREADLRLDSLAGATSDLGGYKALEPGDLDQSELIQRVVSDDPDLRMPPAESHAALDQADIAVLKRWVLSGGEYSQHWSFRPVRRPRIPNVEEPKWCRGPIDRFVLQRIQQAGLSPGKAADPESLLRRVSMDLVGLPPSPQLIDRFLQDPSDEAYERVVDEMLASSDYGERFATPWLDLARYSDTNGYEKDRPRTIWPFRDWVIRALNFDMPFDQFSIEQLAGDMLPGSTRQQRIATGFHRNTMLNEEGGIDPLEYRYHALVDRVATTGTVWMGLTTGCAQCHTHKYDPLTHTDYFSLMALLDDADEPEMDAENEAEVLRRNETLKAIRDEELSIAKRVLIDGEGYTKEREAFTKWAETLKANARRWETCRPTSMASTLPYLDLLDDGSILASGDATKRDVYTLTMPPVGNGDPVTAIRLEAISHDSLPAGGPGLAFYEGRRGDFFLSEMTVSVDGREVELAVGSTSVPGAKPGQGKTYPGNVIDGDGSTGWSIPGNAGQTHRLVIPFTKLFTLDHEWTITLLFERHYVAGLGHFRIDVTTQPDPVALTITPRLETQLAESQVDHVTRELLAAEFLRSNGAMKTHRRRIDELRKQLVESTRTLVMRERPKERGRKTHRYHRGEYLQPREEVLPGIPDVFRGSGSTSEHVGDRLQLARWLVSDRNPLVGRVSVNRAWRSFFGTGIVDTAGDFGLQSEPPSHPDLIDYLDASLRDSSPRGLGWSMKRLHRAIVLSSTYRLAVGPPPVADPENRLLSVFPYRRYDAERIRDSFLDAAGLLVKQIGGPSVYPPQPGVVMQIAYGKPNWNTSKGADRFRRSLYTFSKRTAPFAAFTAFDAPSGEQCIARRDQSTTPLQALTLMNDEMFIEMAEALAEAVIRELGSDAGDRQVFDLIFRRVLARAPASD
ncbi:MAG: PSD1 and planctomycete cytochrome C domain-containing protein, partial [Planctomycetota bacterium]